MIDRRKRYIPERAGDGSDEKEADRHENEAHLHPSAPRNHLDDYQLPIASCVYRLYRRAPEYEKRSRTKGARGNRALSKLPCRTRRRTARFLTYGTVKRPCDFARRIDWNLTTSSKSIYATVLFPDL